MESYDLGSLTRMPPATLEHAPSPAEAPPAPVERAEPRVDLPVETPTGVETDASPGSAFAGDLEQDLPPDLDVPGLAAPSAGVAAAGVAAAGLGLAEPQRPPIAAEPRPVIEDLASAPLEPAAPFPWGDRGSSVFLDSDELEQTLIVPRRDTGERFVLQFSTGESVTVFGTGLLGRNPMPQPGEYFDHLVVISDPGKSVSKTHLEFGQEAGAFWVSDRFSGNGSVVREPEMPVRRLVAGKRYRVVRGTRIDIGEQFLVVS